ncbi:MAG: hypothetical protein ACJAVK_000128 [Akkermansiaceae bacterium]
MGKNSPKFHGVEGRYSHERPGKQGRHHGIAIVRGKGKAPQMQHFVLVLPVIAILGCFGFGFSSCGSAAPSEFIVNQNTSNIARWLKNCTQISWLPRQVSGRYDGASALDNINQVAAGQAAKRSSYGTAPGGSVRLNSRMLRAMRDLVKRGYTFRVTAIAGASHSPKSSHYVGVAFDVDTINGERVGYGNPYCRRFLQRCRELGATEIMGPGDRGHATHLHVAWPRELL